MATIVFQFYMMSTIVFYMMVTTIVFQFCMMSTIVFYMMATSVFQFYLMATIYEVVVFFQMSSYKRATFEEEEASDLPRDGSPSPEGVEVRAHYCFTSTLQCLTITLLNYNSTTTLPWPYFTTTSLLCFDILYYYSTLLPLNCC